MLASLRGKAWQGRLENDVRVFYDLLTENRFYSSINRRTVPLFEDDQGGRRLIDKSSKATLVEPAPLTSKRV